MAFKPFKPPTLKASYQNEPVRHTQSPANHRKRIRLSPEEDDKNDERKATQTIRHDRQPLRILHNLSSPETDASPEAERTNDATTRTFYSVMWRKFTLKKNKTWDDDGVLSLQHGQATLYDSKGRQIGTIPKPQSFSFGSIISVSGREVQIESEISREDFDAVVTKVVKSQNSSISKPIAHSEKNDVVFVPPKPRTNLSMQEQMRLQIQSENRSVSKPAVKPIPPTNLQVRGSAFKQPLKENTVLAQVPSETPIPRHDPNAVGSLVFKRPRHVAPGKQIVDVVLDPLITKHLRDHQRDGIQFLYECVMGMRNFNGQGCILADDMGLGKTLQTIALLWTLIKQNPIYKSEPVVKKALIVCPVTLVENWKKEFRKWLGRDRLGVMTFGDKGSRLSMFDGKNFKVMIVGYERLRTIAEDLTRGSGIDIIVCDEGHRLKTLQNKSTKAIETLNTPRRIILSGTPIQNDLSEFFAMANFVNDGVLGSYKAFVKDFEKPIMKSRQPDATEDDIERGEEASGELASTTSPFILRRTAEVLSDYLPPKSEYVLFCQPTPEQAEIYRNVLRTPMFQNALGNSEAALQMITILKKLCNSPALMRPLFTTQESTAPNSLQTLQEMLPPGLNRFYQNSLSSKIRLLDELLRQIRRTTDDKVVLVSNYTSTLSIMENVLLSSGMTYRRLDGSVSGNKRQNMVDEFNRASTNACFAFLLSAKAGGTGINLIGGNRLILFDVDWNPATDDQAMARIHRDGQRKPCKIYRFLIKGGLEERIWQRQVVKRGLAESIMESGSAGGNNMDSLTGKSTKGKAAFSKDELRDLFRLDEREGLQTHDLIGCSCRGKRHGHHKNREPASEGGMKADAAYDIDDLATSESDTDTDSPLETGTFVKASALSDACREVQEEQIVSQRGSLQRKRKRIKRRQISNTEKELNVHELMMYTHIDTSGMRKPDIGCDDLERIDELIDDECLMHIMKLDKDVIPGGIQYVFKKSSMTTQATNAKDVDQSQVL